MPNLTSAAQQAIGDAGEGKTQSWSCNIDKSTGSSYKVNSIRYVVSGKSVKAQQQKIMRNGPVTCYLRKPNDQTPEDQKKKIELGEGTSLTEIITTNEIVSTGHSNCGGVTVYMGDLMKLNTGKVLSSWVNKTTEAPLR